jgi:acyl carrier protein
MMSQEIQNKLLDFITRSFFVEKADINLEVSLMDAGIIDSMGLIEIISFMEKEFSIVVEDNLMTRENLGSVTRMVNFIERETGAKHLNQSRSDQPSYQKLQERAQQRKTASIGKQRIKNAR